MNGAPGRPWPAHADDLDAVLAEAFRLLARGVADRRSTFHTPTVATVGRDGAPSARTMVLRGFDAGSRTLRLHTDRRAAKVVELISDPRVAIHVYDAAAQIQVRLAATATWHEADVAAAWAASQPGARRIYAAPVPPGVPVATPPSPPPAADGFANFLAIACVFDRLEWLWLAAAGHRRARFIWADGRRDGSWLAP